MKKYLMIIPALLLMQSVFSQDKEKKHEMIESKKIAFITDQLQLSPEESQSFWPVYNQYQNQMRALRDGMERPKKMKEMTDDDARKTIQQILSVQEKELQLQKQLFIDLDGIIPPTKMVKLHHTERRFREKLLDRMRDKREKRKK